MIKNKINSLLILTAVLATSACTQYTPSMMNTSPVQLSHTTMMEQIPLSDLNGAVLNALADHYAKNGTSVLDLTMTYNPTSKDFTAMKAVHELGHIKAALKKRGIKNITTQTTAIPNGMASLMVSYDMVQALAPTDCGLMPGIEKDKTTRFIGDYKFGCSTETMIARQIAYPSDLQGNAKLGAGQGRRAAAVVDGYGRGEQREPLEGLGRDNLGSN